MTKKFVKSLIVTIISPWIYFVIIITKCYIFKVNCLGFNNVKFFSVDVDQVSSIVQRYRVKMVPTILLLDGGKEVNRINGLVLTEPLRKALRSFTNKDKIAWYIPNIAERYIMEKKETEADKIWEEIKDRPIDIFGLTNKKVSDYIVKIGIPDESLHVKLLVGAAIVGLEQSLGSDYDIELAEQQYLIISRASKE